jgi:hypothetical protein
MRNCEQIVADPSDKTAQTALSAIINALAETDRSLLLFLSHPSHLLHRCSRTKIQLASHRKILRKNQIKE